MDLVSGIVVYILLWWWVFFMTLPVGVKTQDKDEVEAGHDAGAPRKTHLWIKAAATTVIAAVLFAGVYWIIDSELISFREMAKEVK